MQFLYKDGDGYCFMDTSSYEQIHITAEALGESVNYLKPEMTVEVEFYGEEALGVELPATVDLAVTDTTPGIKGATASAQVKPATLETGLVVQVPPFVNPGDMVRVSTETGEYLVPRLEAPPRTARACDAAPPASGTLRQPREARQETLPASQGAFAR